MSLKKMMLIQFMNTPLTLTAYFQQSRDIVYFQSVR